MPERFVGGCLCGAIRFAARPPSRFVVHCHCAFCRAAHGAAFVTWAGFPDGQFGWISGEDDVSWFQSSPQSRRGFCRTCGSTMFFRSAAAPNEMHVACAVFDGPIDLKPTAHIFIDQCVPWAAPMDDLPRIVTGSDELSAYAEISPRKPPR